jgi:hypothetical protein
MLRIGLFVFRSVETYDKHSASPKTSVLCFD